MHCENCGNPVKPGRGAKAKPYCSALCRMLDQAPFGRGRNLQHLRDLPEPFPAFRLALRAVMLTESDWAHRVTPHQGLV